MSELVWGKIVSGTGNKILYFTGGRREFDTGILPELFSVICASTLKQTVIQIASHKIDLLLIGMAVSGTETGMLLKMLAKYRPLLRILLLQQEKAAEISGFADAVSAQSIFLGDKCSDSEILTTICRHLGHIELLSKPLDELDIELLAGEASQSLKEELVETRHFAGLAEKKPETFADEWQKENVVVLPDSDILAGYTREKRLTDPDVSIVISKDFLSARLICYPVDYFHNVDSIKKALSNAGVLFGVDNEKIETLLAKVNREREPVLGAVIARGKPPVDGLDAKIKYNFSSPDELMIKENEEGRVDYKSVREIPSVRKGDVLAVVIPPTEPQHGCGVNGKPLSGKPGKRSLILPGRGVFYNSDDCCFYAEIDGYATLLGNRIQVIPLYAVASDVDYSTGNLDFVGTVVVNGNISSGFSVKAEGDVVVQGVIESSACVYAGGNITAKGVIGGEKGRVEAKGEVRVRWCQDANIVAEKDVHIFDVALNSNITSLGYINVKEKKGAVVGGSVRAVKGMRIKLLGSKLEVPTLAMVGENFRIMDLVGELNRLQKVNKQNRQKILFGLQAAHRSGVRDPEKLAKLQKLTEIYKTLEKNDAEFEVRKGELLNRMEEKSFARIQIRDTVFGNTKIQIGTSVFKVPEAMRNCSFYDDGVSVRVGLYDGSY